MKVNKFLLCWLCIICLISCKNKSETNTKPVQRDEFLEKQTELDSAASKASWDYMNKKLVNIDSAASWNFIWKVAHFEENIRYMKEYHTIEIAKLDLTENGVDEIFVTIGETCSMLFQQQQGNWVKIWDGYEDGGKPPRIIKNPQNWITSYIYTPCSHCSNDGIVYHKVLEDSIIDVIFIAWGYNYDYDYDGSNLFIYEQANADFSFNNNILIANFDMQFSLSDSKTPFIKDESVQVVYEWDDTTDSLKIQSVIPAALYPYFLKWYQLEKQYNIRQKFENAPHRSNTIVWLAYFDFKKEFLIHLKNNPQYKKDIDLVEKIHHTSWKKFILEWSSWGNFD